MCFSSGYSKQSTQDDAKVHIIAVSSSGQILPAKVGSFLSKRSSTDLAKNFSNGFAASVPFGVYRARVYSDGFWSSEREIPVYQSEVWSVVQLQVGEEN